MSGSISYILELFKKHPKVAGIIGLPFAILFLWLSLEHWDKYQKYKYKKIENLTIEQAQTRIQTEKELPVTLTNAIINCKYAQKFSRNGNLAVPITDPSDSVLVVGEFRSATKCENIVNLPVTGIFDKINPRYYSYLASNGFSFGMHKSSDSVLHICTFCGASSSKSITILSVVLFLCSISFYPLALQLQKSAKKKNK